MFLNRRIATSGSGDKFKDEFSVAFDGSSDVLTLNDTTLLDGLDDLTITCWIKPKTANRNPILSKGNYNDSAATFNFTYNLDSSVDSGAGRIQFSAGNSVYAFTSNLGAEANKWHHMAVTYSNTDDEIFFYLNGNKITPTATSGDGGSATFISLADTVKKLKIGGDDSNYAEGNISEVSIYNSVLNPSQIKTIYNDREPYNHKEGVASNYLKAWWRMGDNSLDKLPLIVNSLDMTVGNNILTNPNFDSNITGWDDYSSGTVSHETSIVYLGSGSLKTTFDGTNDWAFRTTDNFTLETNSSYLIEAYCYIPSSNGASNLQPLLTTGGTFGSYAHGFSKANSSLTNQWQYISNVTITGPSDTSGKLYGNALNNPDNGDILYWDNITIKKIGSNAIAMQNMPASGIEGDTP